MKKRLLALLLTAAMIIGLFPVSAFAGTTDEKYLGDCELLFDGEDWKDFIVEDKSETVSFDELHISVIDREGNEIDKDKYDIVVGIWDGWDDENNMPRLIELDEPYSLSVDPVSFERGYAFFDVYAAAKENSGYVGTTDTRTFAIRHLYSFNEYCVNMGFDWYYRQEERRWAEHEYFVLPSNRIYEPDVRNRYDELIDPSYYTLTYYRINTEDIMYDDWNDPEYLAQRYPEEDALDGMPTENGDYFVVAEAVKEPYYGKKYVDFTIVDAEPENDFGKDVILCCDGDEWKSFTVDNKSDSLTLEDLRITLTTRDGSIVPEEAYDITVKAQLGYDDEARQPILADAAAPFSIADYPEFEKEGFGTFIIFATAREGSGYHGTTEEREFYIWHKFCLNFRGANANFGNQYRRNSTWSWHDYFKIPEGRIAQPKVYSITNELIPADGYAVTYYVRGTEIPERDDPEYDKKIYPDTEPLEGMPAEPGYYYARIDGAAPYYGTSYVDFDIYVDDTSAYPESYAKVRGSDKRYYEGSTIYIPAGESADICFITEPELEGLISIWYVWDLRDAGFKNLYDSVYFEDDPHEYMHIDASGLQPGTKATFHYNWYRFDEFYQNGEYLWNEIEPLGYYEVNFEVTPTEYRYLIGDANGSGEVDIVDVTMLQRYMAGMETGIDEETLMHGDVDSNGEIESVDVTFIQRKLAFMRVPYPVDEYAE